MGQAVSGFSTLGWFEIGWDEEDLELTELPIQFVPEGSWPDGLVPPPSSTWTPGQPSPLKRVVRHSDGAAAANVALVTADGQCFEVTHPSSSAGRKEISLDFGDASVTSARFWARKYLDEVHNARAGVSIELIPEIGPQPYRDFGIGDNISVLGEQHRVVAIGFHVDARSIIEWSVDLDQPRMLLEERLASIMRRQMPGSAGGRTVLPSPTEPSFPTNQAGSEQTETWSAPATGTVVLRKNGVAIPGASLAGAGKVTLTDAARRYVKESDLIDFTIDGVAGFPAGWKPPSGRWLQEFAVAASGGGGSGVTITVRYV